MAIYLITGNPGSGKTYLAITMMLKHYNFKKDINEYVIKENQIIITNIHNLKLEHEPLTIFGKNNFEIGKNFNIENFEELIEKRWKDKNISIYIDESQFIFDRKFYNKETFSFFQYHRHLGLDIYLITQSSNLIPRDLFDLIETETRAIPRKLAIARELKYKILVNKQILSQKVVVRDKKVYALYQSMEKKEGSKIRNPLIKFIIIPLVLIPILAIYWKRNFLTKEGGVSKYGKQINQKIDDKKIMENNNFKTTINTKERKKNKDLIRLSYAIVGKKVLVYNPVSKILTPIQDIELPIKQISKNGRYLNIIAEIEKIDEQKEDKNNGITKRNNRW